MIRWLWSRMMKWGWDYGREVDDQPFRARRHKGKFDPVVTDDGDQSLELPDPISFKVQAVAGGTLIETRWYDAKNDDHVRKLHIVTNEENLAEAIGRIVTMELLKR